LTRTGGHWAALKSRKCFEAVKSLTARIVCVVRKPLGRRYRLSDIGRRRSKERVNDSISTFCMASSSSIPKSA
jgi:hypothetical protein